MTGNKWQNDADNLARGVMDALAERTRRDNARQQAAEREKAEREHLAALDREEQQREELERTRKFLREVQYDIATNWPNELW